MLQQMVGARGLPALKSREEMLDIVLREEFGRLPDVPVNYFPDDDDTKEPLVTWRSHANLLFYNWLNYYVYQTTPYDITKI